jgi:hypothetical protein
MMPWFEHGSIDRGEEPTLFMVRNPRATSKAGPILAAQYVRMSTEHQQYSIANQADAIGR